MATFKRLRKRRIRKNNLYLKKHLPFGPTLSLFVKHKQMTSLYRKRFQQRNHPVLSQKVTTQKVNTNNESAPQLTRLEATHSKFVSDTQSPNIRHKTTKQFLETADSRIIEGPLIIPETPATPNSELYKPMESTAQPPQRKHTQ